MFDKFDREDIHEELLGRNPGHRLPEKEPTPEKKPEIKFSWPLFGLFSLLMIFAWILGQYTPWFPDELAAELLLFGIYSYLNTLGFRRRK